MLGSGLDPELVEAWRLSVRVDRLGVSPATRMRLLYGDFGASHGKLVRLLSLLALGGEFTDR